MEVTWVCLFLAVSSFYLTGTEADMCRPACAADEMCNIGVCQKLYNCECAVDLRGDKCKFKKRTGDDEAACEAADCCWNKKKRRCFPKNTRERVKECSRLVDAGNRADFGWQKITPNDCFCVGGCYDDSIKDTFWCFEPKEPLPPLPVPVGGVCDDTDTCEDSLASCKGGFCTCPDGYFAGGQLKDKCKLYVELDKACETGDLCKDEHASCDGTKCSCDDNFHNKNGVCVGEVPLDNLCDPDDQCADPNAECVGTCECKNGFFDKGGVCEPLIDLDKPCSAGDVCKDANAECTGGKCSCKDNFHNKNGACVGTIDVGDTCNADDRCGDPNASCVGGTCQCNDGYYNKGGVCTPEVDLGGSCAAGCVCKDPNASGTSGTCVCNDNYINKGGVCVGEVPLGQACDPDDRCADPNSQCVGGVCTCNSGYFVQGDHCEPDIELGHACSVGDRCKDDQARCSNGACRCNDGFHPKDGVCVGEKALGEACDDKDKCADPEASCQNNVCACDAGFYEKNGVCAAEIDLGNGPCGAGDKCKDDNAECSNNACACKATFINKGGVCVGVVTLGAGCDNQDKCADPNASCVGGKCTCNDGFFDKSGTCEAVIDLGGGCSTGDVCKDPNAVCVSGACRCKTNYAASGGVCIEKVDLGASCNGDVCKDPNAVCDNNICTCAAGFIDIGGVCTEEVDLGGQCSSDEVCKDPNAVCTNNVCSCKDNFVDKNGVCTEDNAPPPSGICPAGMTFNKQFGACYMKGPSNMNWCDAQDYCKSLDPEAHLVEIQCQKKQDYVNSIMGGDMCLYGGRHLVGAGKAEFVWSYSQTPMSYFKNWESPQPDRITTNKWPQTPPDCLIGNAQGRWYDTSCKREAPFLCEKYTLKQEVQLGDRCTEYHICATPNSECRDHFCMCKDGFQDNNGECAVSTYAGVCPGGMTYNAEFSACYKEFHDPKSWCEANKDCKALDPEGHLVEIKCQKKQDFVNSLMGGSTCFYGGRHLTGGAKGDFYWVYSDVSLDYKNWNSNQPDRITTNTGPQTPPDCLIGGSDGKWYDTSCQRESAYLCEKYVNSQVASTLSTNCPDGMTRKDSSCYAKIAQSRAFGDAQSFCENSYPGGNLVQIDDQDENGFVRTLLGAHSWIGGHTETHRLSNFHWQDFPNHPGTGASFTYSNFHPGEPNNSGGYEDCTELYTSGLWNDIKCGHGKQIVCQADPRGGACPNGMTLHDSMCYSSTTRSLNFGDAQRYCESVYVGGNLVTIVNAAQNAYVTSLIHGSTWIGGRAQNTGQSDFRYQNMPYQAGSGPDFFYTNWNNGEPNGASEDCVEILTNGRWNDLACNQARQSICQVRDAAASCPGGMSAHGDHCYAKVSSAKTFPDSQSYCENTFGGNLASIESDSENAYIQTLVTASTWIGAMAKWPGYENFRWLNSQRGSNCPDFSFTNWNAGEPNNLGDPNEDCTEMYTSGFWNDMKCSNSREFVCEAPSKYGKCPLGMSLYESSCYIKVGAGRNFGDAQWFCVNKYPGGNLASISDAGENNYVKGLISGTSWLGGRARTTGVKDFRWQCTKYVASNTGPPMRYSNWHPGEPNDAGSGEDCALMYHDTGLWNDGSCASGLQFVCEVDL